MHGTHKKYFYGNPCGTGGVLLQHAVAQLFMSIDPFEKPNNLAGETTASRRRKPGIFQKKAKPTKPHGKIYNLCMPTSYPTEQYQTSPTFQAEESTRSKE